LVGVVLRQPGARGVALADVDGGEVAVLRGAVEDVDAGAGELCAGPHFGEPRAGAGDEMANRARLDDGAKAVRQPVGQEYGEGRGPPCDRIHCGAPKSRSDEPEPLLPGPAKSLKRTAPGRRSLAGAWQVLLLLKHHGPFGPCLAGSEESRTMLTHRVGLSTGLVWPA